MGVPRGEVATWVRTRRCWVDGVDFAGQIARWQQPADDGAVNTPIFDELLRRYLARLEDIDTAGSGPGKRAGK